VTAAASVIGAAAVLTACSSSGAVPPSTSAKAPRALLEAYDQTVGGKTANVALTETVSFTPNGKATKQATVTATGSVDFTSGNGQFVFQSGQTGAFALRFISPELYIQPPASDSSQLPAGKSWASINLNTLSEAKLGASLAQLSEGSQEFTQTLSYLQAVSTTGITTVGPATIRGVATTEYKATIDLAKADSLRSPQAQAALKSLESKVHTSTEPVQVWLDAQGRVNQMSYQVQASIDAGASSGSGTTSPAADEYVTSTIDYFDFGAAVSVVAPPSGQVADLTSQAVASASTTTTGP
jgi:hypothetical protein